jgi:hypothetical protein
LLFAAACGASGSSTGTVEELKQTLPTRQWVSLAPQITQAAPASTCTTLGPSTFGTLTHKIASDADGVLTGVLSMVGNITQNPPSASAPGHAAWGPISSATSSVYQLQVDEAGPSEFHFVLAGKDATEDWRGVFQGVTFAPDPTHRTGQIAVDFGVMHALDPTVDPASGGVAVSFTVDDTAREVTAQLIDAKYHLVTDASQNTLFQFATPVDFDNDGTKNEVAQIDSHWAPTGAGVAHLVVGGGSLGTRVVNAVECWAPTLERTFYTDDASMHPTVGDPTCCPF